MLSPWVLGFAAQIQATLPHVGIGLVIVTLSSVELCRTETLCLED